MGGFIHSFTVIKKLEVENHQQKSPDNFIEKTKNDLKNLFELIIQTENDINNVRKNLGTF